MRGIRKYACVPNKKTWSQARDRLASQKCQHISSSATEGDEVRDDGSHVHMSADCLLAVGFCEKYGGAVRS